MTGWAKIKKAAAYADIGERSFRKWLRQGLKHSRLPSGTILIRYSDIDEWLNGFEVNEDHVSKIVDEVLSDLT